MPQLHPTQKKLLKLLEDNIDSPLTIRELQDQLDLSSPSLVAHHIQQIERKGYLKRNPHNPQDYLLLKDPERPVVRLNLYGLAQCGPNGSILDGKVIDRIPMPTKFVNFNSKEAFLVKARGDSMEPLIKDGDYTIVRKSSVVENGRIAVCVNDGIALIKKIQKVSDTIFLMSLNDTYKPIVASDDFKIEGEVRGVFSALA